MTIGLKIKELRKKNDLTQEKLADYLHVSYQAVSKWETGISSPDLSLIAPLTKLLHVSADELFGLTDTEPDMRRTELEEAYKKTWNTGDLEERYKITEAAVQEYPADMKYLDWFAWTEAMRSFEFKDDEIYRAEQEKAIKHFAMIIEDCTDDKIKSSAIRGIVQYLSFPGRKDEAKKYADLYPENGSINKDDVIADCLSGEELISHKQKMLDAALNTLIDLTADNAAEAILRIMFPDENYLVYHMNLFSIKIRQARDCVERGVYDEAVKLLKQALFHACEYDKIDRDKPGKYRYTAPLFDHVEYDTREWFRTGTESQVEGFYEELTKQWFNPLREREDFKKLVEKE